MATAAKTKAVKTIQAEPNAPVVVDEASRIAPGVRVETDIEVPVTVDFDDATETFINERGLQVRMNYVALNRFRISIQQTPDKRWEAMAGVQVTKGR